MPGMVPYEGMEKTAEVVFEHFPETIRLPLVTRSFEWISEGGSIAWGIVPVVDDLLSKENVQSLIEKLEIGIDLLVRHGIDEDLVANSSWVLPSCETVLLSPEKSDLALSMTSEISRIMKRKYGFM